MRWVNLIMPFSAYLWGGAFGLTVKFLTNALMKQPLARQPWEHVLFTGVGAFMGQQVYVWQTSMEQEVNELIHEREAMDREYNMVHAMRAKHASKAS